MTRTKISFLTALAFGLGVILSGCDPLSLPYLVANRIFVYQNTPYLLVSEECSYGVGGCSMEPRPLRYFVSHDYGITWEEIQTTPTDMPPAIETPANSRITNCVTNSPQICYSITGEPQVEASRDGGKTWEIDWRMPPGRDEFIERNPKNLYHVKPDTIPYDIGIIETSNEYFVITAMGNQGVLVRSPDGNWNRYAVLSGVDFPRSAIPFPYRAKNLNEATQYIRNETVWALLLSFSFFVLISMVGWGSFYSKADKNARLKLWGSCLPFIIPILLLVSFVVLTLASLSSPALRASHVGNLIDSFWEQPSIDICVLPVIGLIISWLIIVILFPKRILGFLAFLTALGFTVIFLSGIWVPFALWAYGIIPIYRIAFMIVVGIGSVTVFLGLHSEKKIALATTDQEKQSTHTENNSKN